MTLPLHQPAAWNIQREQTMYFLRKYGTAGVALLLCLTLLSSCTKPEQKKAAHLQKGIDYAAKGDTLAAILEFRNAIKIDPKFPEARYQLGLAYLKTGEAKQALGQFDRAATLDPQNIDAQLKAAEIFFLGKNTQESRKRVEKILATDANAPDAYSLLANLELQDKKFPEALQAVAKAIQLKPQQSRYSLVKAHILTAMKDYEGAEKAILLALAQEHENIANHNALVTFYAGTDKPEQAENALREMIATFPDLPDPHITLAELYLHKGQLAEAEKSIKEAISKKPEASELYVIEGNFYRKTRQPEKAEKSYRLAIAKSTDKEEFQAILADFYVETGRIEQARQEITEIRKAKSNSPQTTLVRAKLLLNEKKNTEALSLTDKLVSDFPRWGEAYYLKAVAHLGKGEAILSLQAVTQALQFSPSDPKARTLLAHLMYLKRDFKSAIQEAARSLALQKNNLQAAIILGKALLNSGEADKALKLFTEMEKQLPENLDIIYNKAIANVAMKNFPTALDILEQILTKKPDSTPALVAITTIMLKQQKHEQAIARVRNQLTILPKNPDYLVLLADLIKNDPKTQDEALSLLRKAQAIIPNSPQLYVTIGQLLARMNKIDAAIVEYQALLAKNPNYIQGHMALGTLLELSGDKPGSKVAYQKALALNPNFAPAANNLAWYYSQEKEPDLGEALRLALLAKEQLPDDPNVADTLGWVHYKRGATKLAMTQLTFAVDKLPNNPTVHYHLALTLHKDGQTKQAKKLLHELLQNRNPFPERDTAQSLLTSLGG